MQRRELLKTLALAGVASAFGVRSGALDALQASAAERIEGFSFIFFTDTHIQPELRAADGCRTCFSQFTGIPADFVMCGGDLVYDALGVDGTRAHLLWDLYKETAASIHLPIHYTIGNHDVFGVLTKSGVSPSDPEYGKKAFEDRYGPTHYSFDHKGWHFVVLDSIGVQPDRTWTGEVGDAQIAWLKADLDKTGKHTPVLVVTHIPLVTGAVNYVSRPDWLKRTPNVGNLVNSLMVTDATEVIDVLLDYNVRGVLQGHTHINEEIVFRNLRFSTSGAVCGDWWKGPRAGSAEGYSIVTLSADGGMRREYRNYGFRASV
jgi:3',5'-cyclic AMP phosphodiesterase CpdA